MGWLFVLLTPVPCQLDFDIRSHDALMSQSLKSRPQDLTSRPSRSGQSEFVFPSAQESCLLYPSVICRGLINTHIHDASFHDKITAIKEAAGSALMFFQLQTSSLLWQRPLNLQSEQVVIEITLLQPELALYVDQLLHRAAPIQWTGRPRPHNMLVAVKE